MALVAARDERAFDTIRARHEAAVRRRLFGIVRDADTVEDLLQETLLRLWTRSEQFEKRGSLKAWLIQIATNLALNHIRSVSRRREKPLEFSQARDSEESERLSDSENYRPEDILEMSERARILRSVVDELSEEKQEVIMLFYDAEMEIKEVAERLGIPEGTVKSRLHYSTKFLAR